MANDSFDFLKDVLAAPLGEVISSVGQGVGEAQAALDAGSLANTLELYTQVVGEDPNELVAVMRSIGYTPTFYSIPETIVKTKISMSLSNQETVSGTGTAAPLGLDGLPKKTLKMYAAPHNASFSNKYNLSVNASSEMEFKIVPIPPPAAVEAFRVLPDFAGESYDDYIATLVSLNIAYNITVDNSADGVDPAVIDAVLIDDEPVSFTNGRVVIDNNSIVQLEVT